MRIIIDTLGKMELYTIHLSSWKLHVEKNDLCPICNKRLKTHTSLDLINCMIKLYDNIRHKGMIKNKN